MATSPRVTRRLAPAASRAEPSTARCSPATASRRSRALRPGCRRTARPRTGRDARLVIVSSRARSTRCQPSKARSPTSDQNPHSAMPRPQAQTASPEAPRDQSLVTAPITRVPGRRASRSSAAATIRASPIRWRIRGESGTTIRRRSTAGPSTSSAKVPTDRPTVSSLVSLRRVPVSGSSATWASSSAGFRASRTRPRAAHQGAKRCWWSSTCSPRSGLRGKRIGRCPPALASLMVPGPPCVITTSDSATAVLSASEVRKSIPWATCGGAVLPCWMRTSSSGKARCRASAHATARANWWWSVPSRIRNLSPRVTGAAR